MICLLILPMTGMSAKSSCGGTNKALYSKCCRDHECGSSYCDQGHCLIYGDDHVLRDPKWGERACLGNNKPDDAVCCYDRQCKSNWCALGICSKRVKLEPMPSDVCGPNCRW